MTTQQMFDDAVAQYHALQTGQGVVQVTDQNGESVRYTTANSAALLTYITRLAAILGVPNPFAGVARGPMGFYF